MPTTVSGVREKDMGLADGGFKNSGRRQRYDVVYDEARALSPLPDAELDVPTDFGDVRVYRHGPAGGTSVVLIHGFFLTSAMWWEQVAGLADEFTVYTLDMLGQPGRSSQSAALRTPAIARPSSMPCCSASISMMHIWSDIPMAVGLPPILRPWLPIACEPSPSSILHIRWCVSIGVSGGASQCCSPDLGPPVLRVPRHGSPGSRNPAAPSLR